MSGMFRTSICALAAVVVYGALTPSAAQAPAGAAWLAPFRENVVKLQQAAQADRFAWTRLAELTDTYGNRISGSENLTRAIRWAQATMTKDGLANVRTEKVMVPRWVRGQESAVIVDPPEHPIAMLGLGGSVATPAAGIDADVLVVKDFKDLEARAAQAKGKIVLFNVPYTTYGEKVAYR
jgi:carboxypeptidase Q